MTQPDTPLINIADYARAARDRLAPALYDFVAGGAHDEITLRENRAAYDDIRLNGRVLRGLAPRDLSTTLLGASLDLPIVLAPTGSQRLVHPDGEIAVRRAAARSGTVMTLAMTATATLADVAAAAAGPVWFQLYWLKDRAFVFDLVQRAEAAGFGAILLTVDAPVFGQRERDLRNQFQLPPGLHYENFPGDGRRDGHDIAHFMNSQWDEAIAWRDVDGLCARTTLPVIIKGITHPADAVLAVDHGARGVVVSNHGGRQLDTAPATIAALPAIVTAVADRVPVLLDGGIRRGTDVLKALAFGARAVAIGRPMLYGLAVDGQAGVEAVLGILRRELDMAMALCGCSALADISADLIFDPAMSPVGVSG